MWFPPHVYTWIYHDIPIPNSRRLISIKYHKHWYDSLRKLCYLQLKCMLGIWNQKCQGWKVVFCSLQQVATQNSDLHILIFDTLITKVTKVTSFVPSASLCTRNLNYSSSSLWLVGWLCFIITLLIPQHKRSNKCEEVTDVCTKQWVWGRDAISRFDYAVSRVDDWFLFMLPVAGIIIKIVAACGRPVFSNINQGSAGHCRATGWWLTYPLKNMKVRLGWWH